MGLRIAINSSEALSAGRTFTPLFWGREMLSKSTKFAGTSETAAGKLRAMNENQVTALCCLRRKGR